MNKKFYVNILWLIMTCLFCLSCGEQSQEPPTDNVVETIKNSMIVESQEILSQPENPEPESLPTNNIQASDQESPLLKESGEEIAETPNPEEINPLLNFPWIPSIWLEVENNGSRWGFYTKAASSRGSMGILLDQETSLIEFYQYMGTDVLIYTVLDAGVEGDSFYFTLSVGYDDYTFSVYFTPYEDSIYQWNFPGEDPLFFIQKKDEALYTSFASDYLDAQLSDTEKYNAVTSLYNSGDFVSTVQLLHSILDQGNYSNERLLWLHYQLSLSYANLLDPITHDTILFGTELLPLEILYNEINFLINNDFNYREIIMEDESFRMLKTKPGFLKVINQWDFSEADTVRLLLNIIPRWSSNRNDYLNGSDFYTFFPGNRFLFEASPVLGGGSSLLEPEPRRGSYTILEDSLILEFDDGEETRYRFPDEEGLFHRFSDNSELSPSGETVDLTY